MATVTDTTNTANTVATSSSNATVTNPKAKLNSDAFMKLLLTELKYQDPTEPMDSEKMLTQTSQLANLETQESTNKLMKDLAEQLKNTNGANSYAISSIGKLASIGDVKLTVKADTAATKFDVYFPNEVDEGKLVIKDKDGKQVKSIDLKKGTQGVTSYQWDLNNDGGARVANGSYSIEAQYVGTNGKSYTVRPGTYPIEAVKFVKGEAQVKIGSTYVPITDIQEFFQG